MIVRRFPGEQCYYFPTWERLGRKVQKKAKRKLNLFPSGGLLVIHGDMLMSELAVVSAADWDEMEMWEPPAQKWYLETWGFIPNEKAYYINYGKTAQ